MNALVYYALAANTPRNISCKREVWNDPKPALEKTRCPALALGGSKDLQALAAENLDVTIQEIPNVNHLFQTSVTGSPSEYAEIAQTIVPGALALIRDWIVKQSS